MQSDNPYASPASIEPSPLPTDPSQPFPLATQGRRLSNLILDNIIMQVVAMAVALVFGVIMGLLQASSDVPFSDTMQTWIEVASLIVNLLVAVGYYAFTEALFQRSPAKFITKTLVVRPDGSRPSTAQIIGRSFARLIPFEAFSFLGTPPVGWHDSLSKTRVIYVGDATRR